MEYNNLKHSIWLIKSINFHYLFSLLFKVILKFRLIFINKIKY